VAEVVKQSDNQVDVMLEPHGGKDVPPKVSMESNVRKRNSGTKELIAAGFSKGTKKLLIFRGLLIGERRRILSIA
jgi:hypothetical protein